MFFSKKFICTSGVILGIFFITGCAMFPTPYMKHAPNLITGDMGGYESTPGPGNLTKVIFYASEATPQTKVQNYVLLRAAQIGKQNGKRYFAAYNSVYDASINNKTSAPNVENQPNALYGRAYIQYHDHMQKNDFSVDQILKNSSNS